MAERRKNMGQDAENERLAEMSQAAEETQQQLEVLRKMIVNADTIDEAGKSIGDMIESVRANHERLIENAAKTIDSLSQDKEMAVNAVEQLQQEKTSAIEDLAQAQADMQTMANEHLDNTEKRVQEAIAGMKHKASEANDRQMLETLKTFNKRLEKFDSMQNNILTLNETMTAILAVLQSPKTIEFDEDGMPVGVKVG